MVLSDLAAGLSHALHQMKNAILLDDKELTDCMNRISRALLHSDVNFATVRQMQANVKAAVSLQNVPSGHDKRRLIQDAVFNEICAILDPGNSSSYKAPVKGKTTVVMFVGLQGSGKTTTCTKYASYHRNKGFNPALVCADTFRAGAFDQLKQNATKARIPFYGSYTESDPVKVAVEGVQRFKKLNHDLIIIDTSGRHKQEAALFEEMRQLSDATNPDIVVFVLDASIGQAALDQARAFNQSAAVGAVIVTKMDGHAKGGGALSAVAATKSPIIFIGTGEHMEDFQEFNTKPFVRRLLGMGDWSGFIDKIKQVEAPSADTFMEKISKGAFNLRLMYEFVKQILEMGALSELYSEFTSEINSAFMSRGDGKVPQANMKLYMTMMDSMTAKELDSTNPKLMNESRIMRIARGSGRPVRDVMELLERYKKFVNIWSKNKGLKMLKKGQVNAQQISKAIPPEVLNQIGGMDGIRNLMKQMGSKTR